VTRERQNLDGMAGAVRVKSTTKFQVLMFDPAPKGRQRIEMAIRQAAPEVRLTPRVRPQTFLRALENHTYDAIILGFPLAEPVFDKVLSLVTQDPAQSPVLFLVGEGGDQRGRSMPHRYTKDREGLASLAMELPDLVQAHKLDSIRFKVMQEEGQILADNVRTFIAAKAIESLEELRLESMYISIDPLRGRWVIRASTYADEIINLIETIEAKGGQVAPLIDHVPPGYRDLLRGKTSLNDVKLTDLLQVLMPWISERDSKRLKRALNLERIFLAPVAHENQMNGILAIGEALPPIGAQAVERFASRFARALTHAKEVDDISARAKGLATLQQVLVSVSSTLDTAQLMENVLDLLSEVVSFDGARVYVVDEGQITITASRGNMRSGRKVSWYQNDLGDSNTFFSQTYLVGKPSLQSEVHDHTSLGEPGSKPDWRSWIAAPIRWHRQVSGVLTLSSSVQGFFQPLHVEITETVARQLGVALENARLLEQSLQRAEKLKIVHEIGRSSVSLLDSQLLVFEAAQRVIQIFAYDQVGIFMVEEDTLIPEIYLYGKDLRERKGIRQILLNSGTIFDEAVRGNVSMVLPDLSDTAGFDFIPGTRNARAAMLIPLSIKGAVVGVMLVLSHSKDGVDEDDVEILQVLAAQLGISLVNARLFSEVRSHAAKLEQRVAERTEELRSQKERTEAILRSVADAVMVLDLEGRLVLANPMAQSLLSRAWSEQLYQKVVALQQDPSQAQASWEFGTESFEALASNVELEGQNIGTVIVLRNITRLKELDRLKSQFVATVSHELRTPLANIKLYLSLLRRGQGDREPYYYQTLESETNRLTTMIEDLLDLSRLDAEQKVEFSPLYLGDLLEDIIETQRPVCANKRLKLIYKASGNPRILGNRDRLIQVFTNLIANAIAYTPAGDSIRVRLLPVERAQDEVGAVVEVDDTGMGIPADELPYVFDRFYRGRMAQQLKIHGSGLGLAIVREIVESHRGSISVRSDIGEGTCFRVWIPLVEGGERDHG
jgi:two-component system phosphate regulon sensor histidine kinase PhoR